jgi:hypothetical protein
VWNRMEKTKMASEKRKKNIENEEGRDGKENGH